MKNSLEWEHEWEHSRTIYLGCGVKTKYHFSFSAALDIPRCNSSFGAIIVRQFLDRAITWCHLRRFGGRLFCFVSFLQTRHSYTARTQAHLSGTLRVTNAVAFKKEERNLFGKHLRITVLRRLRYPGLDPTWFGPSKPYLKMSEFTALRPRIHIPEPLAVASLGASYLAAELKCGWEICPLVRGAGWENIANDRFRRSTPHG